MKNGLCLRKFASYCALLALTLVFCDFSAAVVKADSTPTIRATLSQSLTVTVSVRAKTSSKSKTKIIVSRALDGSARFVNIAEFGVKGKVTLLIADTLSTGTTLVAYKSRLVGGTRSNWSKTARVRLADKVKPPDNGAAQPTPVPDPPGTDNPGSSNPDVAIPSGMTACPRSEVSKVFELVAAARQANSLSAFTEESHLAVSSQKFSIKMATESRMSHDGWFENIIENGFHGSSYGQNIGYWGQLSAISVFNAWMASAGHKANILSPKYSYLGVGCVIDSTGTVWWTQDFGG